MERILSIEIEHFKNHYAGHLAAALLLSLLAPVIMGMEALNQYQAGQILDVYFSLLGTVLLTPLLCRSRIRISGICWRAGSIR